MGQFAFPDSFVKNGGPHALARFFLRWKGCHSSWRYPQLVVSTRCPVLASLWWLCRSTFGKGEHGDSCQFPTSLKKWLLQITSTSLILIVAYIYTDILSGISSGILSKSLTFHLTYYSSWHSLWRIFWHSIWPSIWHSIWQSFWPSTWHSRFDNLAGILSPILSDIQYGILSHLLSGILADIPSGIFLASFLTFHLTSIWLSFRAFI